MYLPCNNQGGTSGYGDYFEHCGGVIWSVVEGPFGLNFDSDAEAAATLTPRFPEEWTEASLAVFLRGLELDLEWKSGVLRLTAAAGEISDVGDATVAIRVICNETAQAQMVTLGAGSRQATNCS